MSYHCEQCDEFSWECGEDPCGSGGDEPDWTICGVAYLPTPIGLRFAVRVVAACQETQDGDGNVVCRPLVKLIPVDRCVPFTCCPPEPEPTAKDCDEIHRPNKPSANDCGEAEPSMKTEAG